jgi:hypothetical protein
VSRIATALERATITWKPGEGGRLELHHDDEVLAWIDGDEVTLEGRRMLLREIRGQVILEDTARGAKVAAMRLVGQGTGRVGAVTLARHRLRVSKASVNPFQWRATDSIGGPVLLEALKFRGHLRIRKGDGFDPDMGAGIAVVALALTALPELGFGATTAAA